MSHPVWLTPRGLARLDEAEEVAISPDGKSIATVIRTAKRVSYRTDVWITEVDGDARPQRLSRGGGSARAARWSPNGDRLAWIRDTASGARIEIHEPSAGTTARATDALAAIDQVAWSPDGRTLAFSGRTSVPRGRRPVVEVISSPGVPRHAGGVVRRRAALHVVDIGTGSIRTIHAAEGDVEAPRWSPDGRLVAVRRRAPGGYRSTIDVVQATARLGDPVSVAGSARSRFRHAAWSPDSATLLLVGDPELSFHPGLWLFDVRTAAIRALNAEPRCEVVDDPMWVTQERAVLHGRERARSGLYELDVRSGEIRLIAGLESRLWSFSADRVASRFALIHESVTQPPAPVLLTSAANNWRDVGSRPQGRRALPSAERHIVRSDGFDVDYWLLRPPRPLEDRKAPAVFVVHGGPHHDVGDEWEGGLRQLLAAQGFLVVWANPRGSTSYGRRFVDAVIGDFGGGEYRDLLRVVDAISDRDDVDETRLGICGHSHGGYMTAWAVAASHRFRAAVAMSPVFDLVSEWGMSDEGVTWGDVLLGGPPGDRPELYRERSPSTHARRARTPTLIVHGGRDQRCPAGQSELMFATLRSVGCPAQLVLYPQADHDLWASPDVVEDLNTRVVNWFDTWLEVPVGDA